MPDSWSEKKKKAHELTPHRAKPDLDNLLGGLMDAVLPGGDAHIAAFGPISKFWARSNEIAITRQEKPCP